MNVDADRTTTLIARLEAATGPNRELDAHIWRAAFAPDTTYVAQSRFNGAWCIYDGTKDRSGEPRLWQPRQNSRVLEVTASLEAALTLVPEGWRWHVDYRPAAQCWHGLHCVFDDEGDCLGTTPAIALCIAALKARAVTQHQRSEGEQS